MKQPDTFSIALLSTFSCLASELSKRGLLNYADLVENVQKTASEHRKSGNVELAEHMHRISEYLISTIPDKSE